MFSKKELRALSEISTGSDNIRSLSKVLDISVPQTYKILKALSEREVAHLRNGTIYIEKTTHISALLNVLNDSPDSYIVLSDSGLEIIRTLTVPRTVSEIMSKTGLVQSTITRKIHLMRRMGMVRKERTTYTINTKLWPKLVKLATMYNEYYELMDPRVPFGSLIYHSSPDLVIFANDKTLDYVRTAFSRYGDYGMTVFAGENIYCTSDRELDIKEIFLHSLYIVAKDRNWRSKMLALIFYVMHKEELKDVQHPVIEDMRTVLKGGTVDGWVPLKEMQIRAEVYGVSLYDH
jgi:DNA-binding MarR family transcriptional regulator